MDAFRQVCSYCRIVPVIKYYEAFSFFFVLFGVATAIIILTAIFFIYVAYNVAKGNLQCTWSVGMLRRMLNALRWVLFCPFTEVCISVFECEDGRHRLDGATACFSGGHIAAVILSIVSALLLLLLVLFATFFYGERQATEEDAEARVSDNSELLLVAFRLGLVIFVSFNRNVLLVVIC